MSVTWTPTETNIPTTPFYEGDTINLSITATPSIGTITTYSVLLNEIPASSGISVTASATEVLISGTSSNVLDQTQIHYSIGDAVDTIYIVGTPDEVPFGVNMIKYISDSRTSAQYAVNVEVEVDESGTPTFYQKNYLFEVNNLWDADASDLQYLMTYKDAN